MNKFKVGDLVSVIIGEPVWYTYLDACRKEKLGKTGTVVRVEQQRFTKEDLLWFLPNNEQKTDEISDDYSETVYAYKVKFPEEPERHIVFSEVHLKAFEMPAERKREFSEKVDDRRNSFDEEFERKMSDELFEAFFGKINPLDCDYTEEAISLIKKLHMRCATLEAEKSAMIKYIDERLVKEIILKDGYPNSNVYSGTRREKQAEINVLFKIKSMMNVNVFTSEPPQEPTQEK